MRLYGFRPKSTLAALRIVPSPHPSSLASERADFRVFRVGAQISPHFCHERLCPHSPRPSTFRIGWLFPIFDLIVPSVNCASWYGVLESAIGIRCTFPTVDV
jgi:hypothetical protein